MINSNVYIDPTCLGQTILGGVAPDYFGDLKERQPEPVGHKYEVMLPAHKYDKLIVKIAGDQAVESPVSGNEPEVRFRGLRVRPYVDRTGRLAFSATADGISIVTADAANARGSKG